MSAPVYFLKSSPYITHCRAVAQFMQWAVGPKGVITEYLNFSIYEDYDDLNGLDMDYENGRHSTLG